MKYPTSLLCCFLLLLDFRTTTTKILFLFSFLSFFLVFDFSFASFLFPFSSFFLSFRFSFSCRPVGILYIILQHISSQLFPNFFPTFSHFFLIASLSPKMLRLREKFCDCPNFFPFFSHAEQTKSQFVEKRIGFFIIHVLVLYPTGGPAGLFVAGDIRVATVIAVNIVGAEISALDHNIVYRSEPAAAFYARRFKL